ncbi:outer membrane protein, multidrug efflux system [Tistlia consotensis]|uniref:Outer membrane protein, multidrug efflux system n=1 Tax=Tistlia consotensis USBA 355 TaxID=560819 RepID=A0A1Y6C004_9PROT|nr:efflux transporter outer membrane subunit [Tistlia consotensis]SMF38592.1 outer membrane protein, multidrug efflux system [Tistlia consotensis USBA 355]SNR37025.1 outer membrane protein, multidrug efflux system [Tistlia consotensis]
MMTKRTLAACTALSLLLGGCSLIPDLEMPDLPVQGLWPSGPAYEKASANQPAAPDQETLADLGWREFFRDAQMQSLIARALANNRDLRVAALNVEKARATYRVSRADLYPEIDAGGSVAPQRTAKDLSGTGQAKTSTEYQANLGISAFELDLFGRIRSLNEQALEQYFETEEARRATQISLISEVASAYLTLLADRQLLALTEDTLTAQQQTYELTVNQFNQGQATQLDVAQARTSVDTARANKALYIRNVAQDRNALQLLVGEPLADDFAGKAPAIQTGDFMTDLPSGLPSGLLLRRPDVREAEHALRAANANIGAARAAFWPTISLTANAGFASGQLTDLFAGGSGAWLFNPSISLPIFDAGRNEANLESAKVDEKIAVAQYEKAIQTAFREVADALAARGTFDDQIAAQQSLVDATQQSYDLSVLRFQQGLDSYLTTLDSQRTLYSAQQTLISLEEQRLANLVTLYQVLGGGVGETRSTVATSRAIPTID